MLLALLLLLPIALHVAMLTGDVLMFGDVRLGRNSLAVYIVSLVYVAAAVFLLRRLSLAARVTTLIYALLLPVVAVELCLRMGASLYYIPQLPGQRVFRPAASMTGLDPEAVFTINRLGVRGPDTDPEDAGIRLLCVGGSSTECVYVSDRATWPWLLQDHLSQRLEQSVYVANAGRSGHTAVNHLYLLQHYQHAQRFDVVVLLCGFNDMTRALAGTYDESAAQAPHVTLVGGPPQYGAYYQRLHLLHELRRRLVPDRTERSYADPDGAMWEQNETGNWIEKVRQRRRDALRDRPVAQIPDDLPLHLERYRADLRRIIAACRERGQRLIMVTQPTLYHRGMSPDDETLLFQFSPRGACTVDVLEGTMEQFNQAMRDTCTADGIDCIDLSALLPKDTSVFYDDCHFNLSGCRLVSSILADRLAPLLNNAESTDHAIVRRGL